MALKCAATVNTQKSTNNVISCFGLIEYNLELSLWCLINIFKKHHGSQKNIFCDNIYLIISNRKDFDFFSFLRKLQIFP